MLSRAALVKMVCGIEKRFLRLSLVKAVFNMGNFLKWSEYTERAEDMEMGRGLLRLGIRVENVVGPDGACRRRDD